MEAKKIINYLAAFHGIYFVNAVKNADGSYTVETTTEGVLKYKKWYLTDDKLLFMCPSTLLNAAEVYAYTNKFNQLEKPEGIRVLFP